MQTFKKKERLCNKKVIALLFSEGSSFYNYPYKVVWKDIDLSSNVPAEILISVSRVRFKKAVERNRIKRLTRECYRKNKEILCNFLQTERKQCAFSLSYTGNDIIPYHILEKKIILILHRLVKEHEKAAG